MNWDGLISFDKTFDWDNLMSISLVENAIKKWDVSKLNSLEYSLVIELATPS